MWKWLWWPVGCLCPHSNLLPTVTAAQPDNRNLTPECCFTEPPPPNPYPYLLLQRHKRIFLTPSPHSASISALWLLIFWTLWLHYSAPMAFSTSTYSDRLSLVFRVFSLGVVLSTRYLFSTWWGSKQSEMTPKCDVNGLHAPDWLDGLLTIKWWRNCGGGGQNATFWVI